MRIRCGRVQSALKSHSMRIMPLVWTGLKMQEIEDSLDEQLSCRPANNTKYSQLVEVSHR